MDGGHVHVGQTAGGDQLLPPATDGSRVDPPMTVELDPGSTDLTAL